MKQFIYSTLIAAGLAAGGSAWGQDQSDRAPSPPQVGTQEYYNNHGGTLRYPGYIHSAPSTGPSYPYSREDIQREREVERSIQEARRQHERDRWFAENERRQREFLENQQRERERWMGSQERDRIADVERQRERDRIANVELQRERDRIANLELQRERDRIANVERQRDRDRPGTLERQRERQRDRDGDGVNNRRDRFPDDPGRS